CGAIISGHGEVRSPSTGRRHSDDLSCAAHTAPASGVSLAFGTEFAHARRPALAGAKSIVRVRRPSLQAGRSPRRNLRDRDRRGALVLCLGRWPRTDPWLLG